MKNGHNIIKPKLVLALATLVVITLSIAALHFAPYALAQLASIGPNVNNNDKIKNKNIVIAIVAEVAQVDDRGNLLKGAIEEGDKITGQYVYNIKTPDSQPDDITVGDYQHNQKPYGIAIKAGNLVFRTDPNNVNFLVEIVNRETDNYLLRSYNNLPVSDGVLVEHIAWQLDDNSGKALSSDSLKHLYLQF